MSTHADSPTTLRPLLESCGVCEAQPGEPCRDEADGDYPYECPDPTCDQTWESEHRALSCTMHITDWE